jgi:hypothetical protein
MIIHDDNNVMMIITTVRTGALPRGRASSLQRRVSNVVRIAAQDQQMSARTSASLILLNLVERWRQ